MENYKKSLAVGFILMLLVSVGCAPTYTYKSIPVSQKLDTEVFSANFEPVKRNGEKFYSLFKLTVINKSKMPLEIDWNKTLYLHGKTKQGGFVFKGIEPENVKNKAVPSDLIDPEQTFVKEISPLSKVALAQRKDKTAGNSEPGLYAGILPPGKNGIYLVLRQGSNAIKKIISVEIKKEQE